MITITVLIALAGFICFYITSKRAVLDRELSIVKWGQHKPHIAKRVGGVLLVFGGLLSVIVLGIGAGIFAYAVVLMTVGSLVVLLNPLRILHPSMMVLLFSVSLLLEIL
ncbi:hypothetical protein FKX85_17000 [Echinicola soli]|uniref:Uncharacterized protein n=1 Tax=Echinicola soli TaxID=2591634 RepID=A0A514CLF0_9BACT|nr:hypothetical protein [Echinicola soli]QDH80646.1 hypothetical protein FKX85_17000 [Echinicola soli]